MIRTQLYLPEDYHQELTFLASREKLPVAELVRRFIAQGIKTEKRVKKSGETLLALARMATKAGPKDFSSKHDDYLYGKKSSFGK